MADRDRPWSKFYWSDWDSDQRLRQCSLAAQGLWMRMLCICAKSDPRGYLTIAGVPLDVEALATAVSRPQTEVAPLLEELERWGVFSRDRTGRIYSRRMMRDEKRSKDGRKSKRSALSRSTETIDAQGKNPGPSRGSSRGPSPQRPEARSQIPEAAVQTPQQDGETRAPPNRSGDAAAGLIGIVDDAIARHFGERMRRPWPTPRDHPTAKAWLEAGATPEQVQAVADAVLARMAASGREPPKALAYLDGAVRDAVAGKPPTVAKANGEPAPFKPGPTWEERLRARVGHWQANRWDRRWGPPPDDPRCEVPADLIVEVLGDAAPPAARERLETVT